MLIADFTIKASQFCWPIVSLCFASTIEQIEASGNFFKMKLLIVIAVFLSATSAQQTANVAFHQQIYKMY